MNQIEVGCVIIIDGLAWTVESHRGAASVARSEDGKLVAFATAEAKPLGAGLWCLPGRVEPRAEPARGAVVADVAKAVAL